MRRQRWALDLPLYAVFLLLGPNIAAKQSWALQMVPLAFLLPLLVRRRFPRTAAVLIVAGVVAAFTDEVWAYDRGRSEQALAVVVFTLVKKGDRLFGAVVAPAVLVLEFEWGSRGASPRRTRR